MGRHRVGEWRWEGIQSECVRWEGIERRVEMGRHREESEDGKAVERRVEMGRHRVRAWRWEGIERRVQGVR